MMNLYISDIANLLDLPGAELLTNARLTRMHRYIQREDKARCLAAGLMLRRVFGPDEAQRITVTPLGKPYLPDGPHFSLSHSGRLVVLLVDDCEAGVDVEQIAPYCPAVAQRVFSRREQMWLAMQENDEAFYQLWTGKESIMKALGLGFQLPPESFEILPDQPGPNPVLGHRWYLHWQKLDGHMLCCASSVPDAKTRISRLCREELLKTDEAKKQKHW